MLSDVPNFAYTIGYTNASWTLKADLVADYVVPAAAPPRRPRPARQVVAEQGPDGRRAAVHGLLLRLRAARPRRAARAGRPGAVAAQAELPRRPCARSARPRSTTASSRLPEPARTPGHAGLASREHYQPEADMGLEGQGRNKAEDLKGKGKESAGKATGDEQLEAEGKGDQASVAQGRRREGQGRRQGHQGRPHQVARPAPASGGEHHTRADADGRGRAAPLQWWSSPSSLASGFRAGRTSDPRPSLERSASPLRRRRDQLGETRQQ